MTRVRGAPARRSIDVRIAVALVVAAVVGIGLWRLVQPPSFVPSVTVVNPSGLLLEVSVAPADGGGSTALATVQPHSTTTTTDVVDQGDEWAFRVRAAGVDGGVVRTSRAALAKNDWRIQVPARAVERLRRAGVGGAALGG
jgi:hypothetical protein